MYNLQPPHAHPFFLCRFQIHTKRFPVSDDKLHVFVLICAQLWAWHIRALIIRCLTCLSPLRILALGSRSSDVEARVRQDYQHSFHGQSNRWVMILFPHFLSGAPPCLLLISPFGVESWAEWRRGRKGELNTFALYSYVGECTSH